LGFGAVVLMGAFLIFTRTRGAWFGVCFASLLGVGIVWRWVGGRGVLNEILRHKIAGLLGVFVLVVAIWIPPQFQDVSLSRLDEKKASVAQSIQFVAQEGGDRGRLRVWYNTLHMIADAPLFGVGLNNWSALYPRYDKGDVVGIVVSPLRPHNDFLWIWAESGLLGLLLYVWLLVCVFKQVWVRIKLQDWVALCAGLGALALLIHSCFSFPREQPISVFFLSLALGIAGQQGCDEPKADWRNLGLGVWAIGMAIVGLIWAWTAFQFDVYFSRTLLAQSESRPDKQVQAAQQARAFGLFDHRVLLLEGVGLYALKDYEGATNVYQTYLKYQPYLPAVHNNLGRAFEALGRDDDAEKAYLRGLDTFSGDGAGILISNLAAVYKRHGKIDQALALYESGVQLPAEGHHNLGLIYAERGLWDQSLASYHQALKQAPDMTIVYFSMAGVKMLQGDLEGAGIDYEMFLKHWDGIPDYVRDAQHRLRQIYPVLGDRYLRAQRFADAGRVFERLIDLGEGSPEVLNNLVLICGRLGQFDKAFRFGQLVIKRFPKFYQVHLSMATVYESRGDRDLARKHYRLFLENSGENHALAKQVQARMDALNKSMP
jgi:tetratricopeptide (TPR) repeat protein